MKIITDTDSLTLACQSLAKGEYVTVDTEFLRETTFWPKLCLIQMAGPGEEYIVDPIAGSMELDPFFELMTDESVVKVFHAARQDIEIMHHQGGVIPQPLFDTQVAAMVCGFGDSVGYENLVRTLVNKQIDKTSRFTDWSRRPLTDRQLAYALADVTHLRDVYENLSRQLDRSGRASWLKEEMSILESSSTYDSHPEDAWKRLKFRARNKKSLAVFMSVAAWREREAQGRDVPRNRILKDDALQEIAIQMPKSTEDLDRLRAVPRGFGKSPHAAGLLEAVRTGQETDQRDIPDPKHRHNNLPQGLGPIVEMLKVALKITCDRHGVAQKLIASVADLEQIAASDNADVRAMKGWRRELFGSEALDLKHGRACIVIEDGEAVLLPRSQAALQPIMARSAD